MGEGALSPLEEVQLRPTPDRVGRPPGSGQGQGPVEEEPQEGEQNDQTGQEGFESLTGGPVGRGLDLVAFLQTRRYASGRVMPLPLQEVEVVHVDRLVVPEDGDDDGQTRRPPPPPRRS